MREGAVIHADEGAPVVALKGGLVTAAGDAGRHGLRVWIDGKHLYAHMGEILVKPGDRVETGQILGHVGQTGEADSPRLGFGWSPDGSQGGSWADPHPMLAQLQGPQE